MKIFEWIKRRKLLVGFLMIAAAVIVYWIFFTGSGKASITKYVMGIATTGSIISSVAGSGSVTAESLVEIKPQASGKIIALKIKEGEEVKAGQTLAIIDNKGALNSIRDAEISLEQAKLNLVNIQKPTDSLSVKLALDQYNQAQRDLNTLTEPVKQIDLDQAINAVQDANRKLAQTKTDYETQKLSGEQNLDKVYNDAFNAVFNMVINLHKYTDDMVKVRYDKNIANGDFLYEIEYELKLTDEESLFENFQVDYTTAYDLLKKGDYDNFTKPSEKDQISSQIEDVRVLGQTIYKALGTTRIMMKALENRELRSKTMENNIDTMSPVIDQDIADLNNYLDTLDSAKRNLNLAILNTPLSLQLAKDAITAAEASLEEKQNALDTLREGPTAADLATAREKVQEKLLTYQNLQSPDNSYDINNQKLTVSQRGNALTKARGTLADYSVTAPFDGKISTLSVRLGDTVSSGSSVATIISKEYLAEVDVNEVDVPKIKMGNKVTITLDAFPDDTLTGKVIFLDSVGTASQGVVNYTAKISFDNIMYGVKPGMTVSATIITDVKQDILLVPSGAVKTNADSTNYVEYFQTMPAGYDETTATVSTMEKPLIKDVVVGLSDDTNTEITSGLAAGDMVVVQTISATSKTSTSSSSALRIPGITR